MSAAARLAPWVQRLARLMDSQFRVPGTSIRFGLDPVIGLVPILGDTVTFVMGAVMISEAVRLRLGAALIVKMLGNLAIDWLAGLIPLLDIVLDTAFKATTRNAALLERAAAESASKDSSR